MASSFWGTAPASEIHYYSVSLLPQKILDLPLVTIAMHASHMYVYYTLPYHLAS